MKLLRCKSCKDIFNIRMEDKFCSCGKTSGKYLEDRWHAEYSGPAILIGFDNSTFAVASRTIGKNFLAFTITEDCPTFKHK